MDRCRWGTEIPVSFRELIGLPTRTMLPRLSFLLLFLPTVLPAADSVFAENSAWELVSTGHEFAEGMAWDKDGHFYFTDVRSGQLFKVDRDTGMTTLIDGATGRANGIAFGPDGRLYGCSSGDKAIYAWDPKTWTKVAVTEGTQSNDIVILKDGTIFYTEPGTRLVWRLAAGTFQRELAAKLDWGPNGIAVSTDQKTLLVAEFGSDTIHGFSLGTDSKINGPDHASFKLAVPSDGQGRLDGMLMLADGRLLSGTFLGAQIVPPVNAAAGSGVRVIIPPPFGRPRCNYVRVSPDGEWMYTAYAVDVLRRRLRPGFDRP